MNYTFVDEKNLNTLEDLAVLLTSGILSLNTLHNQQVRSVEIGIMPEDLMERANTIAWDLRRLMNIYHEHLNSVLDLLPEDFTPVTTIEKMKEAELKKARAMTRKIKVKKCDT